MSQTSYPSAPQQGATDIGRVPYRGTPPWGESPPWDEAGAGVLPASSIEVSRGEDLHARQNIAWGHEALHLNWYLDPQYGYPPPGAPNQQDFQSGHTQITVLNQSAEQGWGTDPAFAWPRYPHMENHARAYSWGIARRNGQLEAPKDFKAIAAGTQQRRDLLLRAINQRSPHQVTVTDAPSVPNTYAVRQVSPYYMPGPIGAEGVLPG